MPAQRACSSSSAGLHFCAARRALIRGSSCRMLASASPPAAYRWDVGQSGCPHMRRHEKRLDEDCCGKNHSIAGVCLRCHRL
eukprot:366486-Chlamydomonas_euryale.AAC.7